MSVAAEEPTEQYRDHHERLVEGMATAVRERGLSGSTVADVVRNARVSRRTFYQHFDDLIDCYLELMRLLGDRLLDAVREAVESGGTTEERIDRAVSTYVALLEEEPELSRSYWLEYHLTGERGHGHIVAEGERTAALFGRLAQEFRGNDGEPLPLEAFVMLNGALREIVAYLFEHDRPPREAHAAMAWMVRLVATADPPDPSASA